MCSLFDVDGIETKLRREMEIGIGRGCIKYGGDDSDREGYPEVV
jgi:hypothetical protein